MGIWNIDSEAQNEKADFQRAVKLIHSVDLSDWDIFPRYQQFTALSYYSYLLEVKKLDQLKYKYSVLIRDLDRLKEIETDELVDYQQFSEDIGRSFFSHTKEILLEKPVYEHTVIKTNKGRVENGVLHIKANWHKNKVNITYYCPSRYKYTEEIAAIRMKLSVLNDQQLEDLKTIKESRYNHPIIFVSHRWESAVHPDPDGSQLKKIKGLKDCFLVYDYTSFPQPPLEKKTQTDLLLIFKYMTDLIRNVVILNSDDYIQRGWCIFEYIAASFNSSVVCDEIRNQKFVNLRNWFATRVPFPRNVFRDSIESMKQNFLNEEILAAVNEILPLFKDSLFSVEGDRRLVRMLLVNMLKNHLPSKKSHQMYLGEWKSIPWTIKELDDAFENQLQWESQMKMDIDQFLMNVPESIGEAVQRAYQIDEEKFRISWF